MTKNIIIFSLTVILLLSFCSLRSQTLDLLTLTPDGNVKCLVSKSDTLIVAGDFNHVGKFSGGLAKFTATDDNLDNTFPKVIGTIYSVASDSNGGYFIYGNFRKQDENNNLSRRRIEYIDANGNFDLNISYDVTQTFQEGKLFYLKNTNYLFFSAKTLSQVNGQNCGGLVCIDISTGQLLSWVPTLTGSGGGVITDFAVGEDTTSLYLIGDFTSIGGQIRDGAAKIKINVGVNNGRIAPWDPAANWDYLIGYADMKFYQGNIILGGNFGQVSNPNGLGHAAAVIDTSTGTNYSYLFRSGGAFSNGSQSLYFGASITALTVNGNILYAYSSGTFDTRITAVDLTLVNVFNDVSGTIWARYFNLIATSVEMRVINNELIVAGKNITELYFLGTSNQDSMDIERKIKCAVKLSATTGVYISWAPDLAAYSTTNINCMETYDEDILFGGPFTHANTIDRKALYAFKTSNPNQLLNLGLENNNSLYKANTMKLIGNLLYIAGQNLPNSLGDPCTAVCLDIGTETYTNWFTPNMGEAFAIEGDDTKIYLGGNLSEIGGALRKKLFAFDRSSAAMDTWSPEPSTNVQALHIRKNKLYIGGEFTTIGGETKNRLASYDLPTLILNDWSPNANSTVFTINSKNNTIWIGGSFTQMSGQNRRLFAGVDPISGSIRSTPNHLFSGQPIYAIVPKGCELFLGGGFRTTNTSQCSALTAFDLYTKTMVPTTNFCYNFDQFTGKINSMVFIGDTLYLGGEFSKINGVTETTNLTSIVYPNNYFDECGDYISVQDGNWHNASTWQNNQVPTSKASVFVKHHVTATSSASCYGVLLDELGNLQINNGSIISIKGEY